MKRHQFACSVAVLFFTLVLQHPASTFAGTNDTTKQQATEEELREAYEAYVREMKERQRKEREEGEKAAEDEIKQLRSDPAKWRFVVWTVQMILGHFGYGTGPFDGRLDEKTRQALKEYQTYNEMSATGDIDPPTFKGLTEDNEALDLMSVKLPPYSFSDILWDDFVRAEGTWMIEGSEQGLPLQTSVIHCSRQWKYCIEANSVLYNREPMHGFLSVDFEYHQVERWDAHEIVTKPNTKQCVRYTLRFSRSQKTVTGLRTPISNKASCSFVTQQDLRLRLEDGSKSLKELQRKRREAMSRILRMDRSLLKDFQGF